MKTSFGHMHFVIPSVESVRLKILSNIVIKFRQLQLTTKYVFRPYKGQNPCSKHFNNNEEI